jgi:hypothetical protein
MRATHSNTSIGTSDAELLVPASQKRQTLIIAYAIGAFFARIAGGGGGR